jgi:hypothetical protein
MVLGGVLFLLICVAEVWAYAYMSGRRNDAIAAGKDLRDCAKMAAEIERVSRQPALAAEREQLAAETSGAIESAAKAAGIDPKRLVRITPGAPQRIGDTVYKEKPTHVLLKDVTLKELVAMLHGIASSPQCLNPRSLRLAATQREDTGALWTAEVVVSYLIYEPIRTGPVRSY